MIKGVHALYFSTDAEKVRAFFRDVLEFESIDSGGGWLVFALPPAELGVHPDERCRHELTLMCDDLDGTIAKLNAKGVETGHRHEETWGYTTNIVMPDGGRLLLYQPKHPTAI